MRGVGALLVRGAVADDAVDHDQGRLGRLGLEGLDRRAQGVEVVGVGDVLHGPAQAGEPGRHVLAERQARAALDGDLVVVVEPAQVRQLQVPGERGGLGADALHQATVAGDGVDVVVEQVVAGAVERGGLPEPGDGHADAGRDPGAERAGGALDPGGPAVLGVPGTLRVELAEPLQVVERDRGRAHDLVVRVDRLDAAQVQQRVEQGRGVPGGEHEAVAVGPHRQLRVEPQIARPQRVAHRGQRHRRARVPRVRRLHRVHREHADGVDGQLVDRLGVEVDVRGRAYGHRSGPHRQGLAVNFPTASRGRPGLARSAAAGWWAVSAADLVHDVARFEAGCHGENRDLPLASAACNAWSTRSVISATSPTASIDTSRSR